MDDNPDMRALVRLALAGAEVDVTEAADGFEALARVGEDAYDVVVLDLMMPGLDGLEVCRRLRVEPLARKTPVLVLTACVDEESCADALRAGADDYAVKPLNRRELRNRIQTLLARTGRR